MLIDRTVVCFECKGSLSEAEDAAQSHRRACPRCGSQERAVHIVTAGFIRSSDDLTLEFGNERPEQSHGVSKSDAVGSRTDEPSQLVIVQREFSPDRNLYVEHVEDEATGATLWRVESSLTDYARRRGGARRTDQLS
jgi:hypothetical protein